MSLSLSSVNNAISKKLNLGPKDIYKLSLSYADQPFLTQTPEKLFMFQELVNQKVDSQKLLYAIGLAPNQAMSDAVKQFVAGLSGTNVRTLV
ncbi:MAG: hypothetical protein A2Y40_09725 [Candidatus Margulisbacteria bacterium GWF2_35_9]|nr:MAG: hypothetical protein A2Y40_09725 [Candidatus Margulisbacteria bacterium GWF2_35_9]